MFRQIFIKKDLRFLRLLSTDNKHGKNLYYPKFGNSFYEPGKTTSYIKQDIKNREEYFKLMKKTLGSKKIEIDNDNEKYNDRED